MNRRRDNLTSIHIWRKDNRRNKPACIFTQARGACYEKYYPEEMDHRV